jgi:DNA-binding MarR family transcriptional regulator
MSSLVTRKSIRRELLSKLQALGRKVSTQTVFLHQAIAQGVGLNATDTKCMDLILSHADGLVTAGWLSDLTGLTTGAITHILDRLEKGRFVERVRDTGDRRKIFVRIRPESLQPLIPRYEEIGRAYINLAERYSDSQLEVICDYMQQAAQISEGQLANFVARDGPRSTPSPPGQARVQSHKPGRRQKRVTK